METLEDVKNRQDREVLTIQTMFPEKLLVPHASYPDQVKHLRIDFLEFKDGFELMEKWLYSSHSECQWVYNKDNIYGDMLYFTQLETLEIYDLYLSSDMWTRFAQAARCLKKIVFASHANIGCECMILQTDGLEAILKIPTLEEVLFENVNLPCFPKGPSNMKKLLIHNSTNITNFSTHTALTSVDIYNTNIKFSTLQLDKLNNLEHVYFKESAFLDQDDMTSLRDVMNLPKLNKLGIYTLANTFDVQKQSK
jgi:hypothetical protein